MSFRQSLSRNLVVVTEKIPACNPRLLQIHFFATDERGFSQIV